MKGYRYLQLRQRSPDQDPTKDVMNFIFAFDDMRILTSYSVFDE